MNRWVPLVVAGVAALTAIVVIGLQVASGAQPWTMLLTDNFVLARSIPFTLGLGVAFGAFRALGRGSSATQRRGDQLRRFAPGTAAMHWLTGVAVLVGLATGAWQYLAGLLVMTTRVDMPLVYRVHYVAASVLLFAVAHFVSYWLMSDARRPLLVPKGQWIRHLRGTAHELPRPIGAVLAAVLGLDMRRQPPPVGEFTYYEKTVSFPSWGVVLLVVVVTGVLKAMRYVYPIPGDLLWWVSAIHVGATVALMLKLLDHVRYVLAPSRWALVVASVTGSIGAAYVRQHHPAWLQEVEQPPSELPEATPTAPVSALRRGGTP
jgi:cytochrome b subunit of formate dehydrogenase